MIVPAESSGKGNRDLEKMEVFDYIYWRDHQRGSGFGLYVCILLTDR